MELKLLLYDVEFDITSQDAMGAIYMELSRKLCNICIQNFSPLPNKYLLPKKGLASSLDVNLRTTLLIQRAKVSTICKQ